MDDLTAETISKLLTAALDELPSLQRELIRVLYFEKIPAPKRWGRERHGINGKQFDEECERALQRLRARLLERRIAGMWDVL
jgi:DNA-directed RNA polymerase specialized sigma24 family protein